MNINGSYEEYKKWFDEYSKNYCENEEGVSKDYMQLKIGHTRRVVELIEKIAKSENLEKNQIEIARIIALFHDVGRFPQIHKYKIDNDNLTENHALLSIKVLKEFEILKHEDDEVKDVIYKAIEYHNMKDIPSDEKDLEVILMSKLIRDADKTDIYRMMYDKIYSMPIEKLEELYSNLSFEAKLSDEVYKGIVNKESISRTAVKTMLDHTMLQLSWVIKEIYFKETLRLIKNDNYIPKIFGKAKSDDKAKEIYKIIEERLGEVE